jgi:integrase
VDGKTIGWKGSLIVGTRADGRPDRRWVSGRTQTEVLTKMTNLRSALHTGMVASAEGLTVGTYLTRWLAFKQHDGIRANTLRSYADAARLHLTPRLGRIKLERLTALDVTQLVSGMLTGGKSAASAAYTLRVLKMALRQAVGWGLLPRNVAEVVRPPRRTAPQLQVWTPGQAQTFLTAAEGHRLSAAFYLALMTGLRRGELLGLCWDDIDWTRSRLQVVHNLIEERGAGVAGKQHRGQATVSSVKVQLATPKTAGSRRTVVLSPGTLDTLRAHQVRQAAERARAGRGWEDSGAVFATPLGGHTDPRLFYGWYRQLLAVAEVPQIRFHDLRHTAASLMILRGIPPKTVSERLGHADVAFTLRVYTHLYDDQKEEAAFDLSDFFTPPAAEQTDPAQTAADTAVTPVAS